MRFDGTIEEVERLLATQYWQYQHIKTGENRFACDEYSLPKDVRKHIDFVMPTIQLGGLEPIAKFDLSGTLPDPFAEGADLTSHDCATLMTIQCLRELYKIPVGNTSAEGNKMGIGAISNYLYEPDLPIFFRNFTSPQIPADTIPEFVAVHGGLRANVTSDEPESALDVQTAYSIIYPQGVRLYQVSDPNDVFPPQPFNILLDALDESYCTNAAYVGRSSSHCFPERIL